ncbi:MAG TPA: hypothetical protein VJS92_15720 [Candidatus Polarisedimenticolaceae bacterium]|nr:hypothetical protein [Candidatus Polarisedimenticolaceae bacterium]
MAHRTWLERGWKNHPLERERDQVRVRGLWRLLLGMLVAAAPAAVYLLEQNECLKAAYGLSAVKTEHEQLLEQERSLQLERARLQSLPSIERWALADGGLVSPQPEQVVMVPAPRGSRQDWVAASLR